MQIAGDAPPFGTLPAIARRAAGHDYAGVRIPNRNRRLFDPKLAAESDGYRDDLVASRADEGANRRPLGPG